MAATRHHKRISYHPFGSDKGGQWAESFARFFGTTKYLVGQTILVIIWIAFNAVALFGLKWDPYPFILLNLAFSTQAAYAAPLILLAQNRQAGRDKVRDEADAKHREEVAQRQLREIAVNTELTQKIDTQTSEIHGLATLIHEHIQKTT